MKNIKEPISIVFPVYNEEIIIEKTITDYYNEFNGVTKFEIIVREDGSTDKTKEILKKLSKKFPIRLYMSNVRKGYQWSIIDAIKYVKYDWVFLVDSDYQYKPNDFWKLTEYKDNYDIILGRRSKRMDPPHRIFLSKGMNFLIKRLFHTPYIDITPGFRLIRKTVLEKVIPNLHTLSFFSAELIIRAHCLGYRIKEVPITHLRRKQGSTNVFHLYKLPKMVFKEFIKLFKLKSELSKLTILR